MPSLTPGESAPRSISTRLSSLNRALSPCAGPGLGLPLGRSWNRSRRRSLSCDWPYAWQRCSLHPTYA